LRCNGNGVSGDSSGNDFGGDNKKATRTKGEEEDDDKPSLREGGTLLTRQTREVTTITAALQAV
jgi:hypothetical protein